MLVLACQDLQSINESAVADPTSINTLDLTSNRLSSGADFKRFSNLVHLVLDRNEYTSLDTFPPLPSLETFSANKNQFTNLSSLMDQSKKKFPNLKHLSLVNNPCCPYFEGGKAYDTYKAKVMSTFPMLETLDGAYVGKVGMKINIEPNNKQPVKKQADNEEDSKVAESVQLFKKDAKGYKIKEMEKHSNEERLDGSEDEEQANDKRLLSVIEYNEKYTNKPARNMKLRSEGNRFVKNDQL